MASTLCAVMSICLENGDSCVKAMVTNIKTKSRNGYEITWRLFSQYDTTRLSTGLYYFWKESWCLCSWKWLNPSSSRSKATNRIRVPTRATGLGPFCSTSTLMNWHRRLQNKAKLNHMRETLADAHGFTILDMAHCWVQHQHETWSPTTTHA